MEGAEEKRATTRRKEQLRGRSEGEKSDNEEKGATTRKERRRKER